MKARLSEKNIALSLAFIMRFQGTREWPIHRFFLARATFMLDSDHAPGLNQSLALKYIMIIMCA